MKAFLVIEKGEPYKKSRVITLPGNRVFIGKRSRNNFPQVSFMSPYISRRHAVLNFANNKYYLTDLLTSKHGTCLNGRKLVQGRPYILKHSDRVSLANDEAVFVFCCKDSTLDFFSQNSPQNVVFDKIRGEVRIDKRSYALNGNNFELFSLLYKNRNKLVLESVIRRNIWPATCFEMEREDVRKLVSRLRKTLRVDRNIVVNVSGRGYMLNVEE